MSLNLKIPPGVQGIVSVMLIVLADTYAPLYRVNFAGQYIVAGVLSIVGALIGLAGIYTFIRLGTSADPRTPTKANELVITGVYKFTRNPMYLGLILAIAGLAVFFGTLSGAIIFLIFTAYLTRFQIVPEEVILREKFRDSYQNYEEKVRRWF